MTGEQIINRIIEGSLLHAQCSHDETHGCVVVWSSGAAEQIEATCSALLAVAEVKDKLNQKI